jgi:hypothetical protein
MNTVRKGTTLALVAALTAACGDGDAEGGGSGGAGGRPATLVEVVTARTDTVVDAILTTGTVEAMQSIELRSEIQGRLTEILVREGTEVEAGAPLPSGTGHGRRWPGRGISSIRTPPPRRTSRKPRPTRAAARPNSSCRRYGSSGPSCAHRSPVSWESGS